MFPKVNIPFLPKIAGRKFSYMQPILRECVCTPVFPPMNVGILDAPLNLKENHQFFNFRGVLIFWSQLFLFVALSGRKIVFFLEPEVDNINKTIALGHLVSCGLL